MRALILVDIQNDFCPGGALAVQEGDAVVSVANDIQDRFDLVIASKDWHPADHKSFASNHEGKSIGDFIDLHGVNQILWPDHCVIGSNGAEFHKDLNMEKVSEIFTKGSNPEIDSYSGFYDNDHQSSTGLSQYLKEKNVEEVYIMGLATDYCVKFTALDSASEGFSTYLVLDGCRGVNLSPGDDQKAVNEMKEHGIQVINSQEIQ